MRTSTRFSALFAAALLTLAGCDQQSISAPLQNAPGTQPAPAEPGQIAVVQLTPLAGANYAIGCVRGSNWCNMLLVVDVQLDQDVAEPWVTASFYNGSQRCGGTLRVRAPSRSIRIGPTPCRDSLRVRSHYRRRQTALSAQPRRGWSCKCGASVDDRPPY
jgi:hypothetical protein